ncbi:MAG: hypothetical protein O2972_04035 [Cyanobacteria bacterium]|nr:hypothetical protein [Cyanobacteriota bacterium]
MRYANLSWQAEKARLAGMNGDLRGMTEAANKMERCGYYKQAWKTFHEIARQQRTVPGRPWRGPHDHVRTLVLEQRQRDLGDELRLVHLVAEAAADVGELIVQTEDRLIPLFQRSFPTVRFVRATAEIPEDADTAWTSYEQLALFYAHNEELIVDSFQPLTPPPTSGATRRGLGISWYSKAMYKCLPSLEDWAGLLRVVPGHVQSLQYEEGRAGLNDLVRQSGRPVKAARRVDQFKDLDGYAGQVASVRRVLTISNTTAHMAGALGIPCVVILDRESVTTWPEHVDRSPFYPNTVLIRRDGMDWAATLRRGLERLMQIKPAQRPTATRSPEP